MKRILLFVILMVQFVHTKAQQKSIRSFLTLEWSKSNIEERSSLPIYDSLGQILATGEKLVQKNDKSINFGNPVFSLTKLYKNGKRLREIQLSNIRIKKQDNVTNVSTKGSNASLPISGNNALYTSLAAAYLESFNLSKADNNFEIWLGGGLRIFNSYASNLPKTTLAFPSTRFNTDFALLLVPRIIYKFSKNVFLDIHSPLTINSFSYQYLHLHNPVTPIAQQQQNSFKYYYIPKISEIRFGFGVKF